MIVWEGIARCALQMETALCNSIPLPFLASFSKRMMRSKTQNVREGQELEKKRLKETKKQF
jgi:hypothetical protein